MEPTQQKMKKLLDRQADYRDDFKDTFSANEKKLRESIAIANFADNDVMRKLLRLYAKDLQEIDTLLLKNRKLTLEDRERLFIKQDMILKFINFFSEANSSIEAIDKWLTDELK